MKRKLKICHVITRMIVGGAQENTLLTVKGLAARGHEVTLITGPSEGPEGELLKNHGNNDFELLVNSHLVRELNPYHDTLAYFSLLKLFRKRKFDVVHTHSSKAGVIGRAAANAAGIPFVTHTVHGQAFHRYEKPWKNFIYKNAEKWAARRCHKIYAVSQAMIDQCVEAKIDEASKYKIVYSGMELEPFLNAVADKELKGQLGIPRGSKVIGVIARIFPLKGYEFLIPVAKKITETYPEAHFLIVGDGILRKELQDEIKDCGLSKRFSFAGLVPPNEIHRYTALMGMLMHLSLREGLPRAVVQALASGKPAVGFRLDGTPEVINDGKTGFVVEPRNVGDIINALSILFEHPELVKTMGKNGRNLVSDKFDWKKMVDILEDEYLNNLPAKTI